MNGLQLSDRALTSWRAYWRLNRRRLSASGGRLTLAYVLFAAMVLLGAIPGEAQALSAAFGDKALHFCAYSLLAGLLFCGFAGRPGLAGTVWLRALVALIGVALLGAADEAIQSLLPYRHADLSDWAWNMLAAGWAVASLLAMDAIGVQTGRPRP